MKNEITAKRLRLALENKKISCAELSEKTGISKASISQYYNGIYSPTNIKSSLMAKILDVSPMWLMGFDVPMRQNDYENTGSMFADIAMNPELLEIVTKLTKLKDSDRDIVINLINSLYEKRGE